MSSLVEVREPVVHDWWWIYLGTDQDHRRDDHLLLVPLSRQIQRDARTTPWGDRAHDVGSCSRGRPRRCSFTSSMEDASTTSREPFNLGSAPGRIRNPGARVGPKTSATFHRSSSPSPQPQGTHYSDTNSRPRAAARLSIRSRDAPIADAQPPLQRLRISVIRYVDQEVILWGVGSGHISYGLE
jgi:hypothetical protein